MASIEIIESKERANEIAKKLGFKGAEVFKEDYVNERYIS